MNQIGAAAVQIGVTPSSQGAPRHPMTRQREECLRRGHRKHRLMPGTDHRRRGWRGRTGDRRLWLVPLVAHAGGDGGEERDEIWIIVA